MKKNKEIKIKKNYFFSWFFLNYLFFFLSGVYYCIFIFLKEKYTVNKRFGVVLKSVNPS